MGIKGAYAHGQLKNDYSHHMGTLFTLRLPVKLPAVIQLTILQVPKDKVRTLTYHLAVSGAVADRTLANSLMLRCVLGLATAGAGATRRAASEMSAPQRY